MKNSSLQFQIEKCTQSVFQLDEVYKACFFHTTFDKKLVAETSKELVFLLPQRKIRCATTFFFRGWRKWPQASRMKTKQLRRSKRNQEQSDYEKL